MKRRAHAHPGALQYQELQDAIAGLDRTSVAMQAEAFIAAGALGRTSSGEALLDPPADVNSCSSDLSGEEPDAEVVSLPSSIDDLNRFSWVSSAGVFLVIIVKLPCIEDMDVAESIL